MDTLTAFILVTAWTIVIAFIFYKVGYQDGRYENEVKRYYKVMNRDD